MACALIWALYWSVRLARADALSRQGSARDAAGAVQLAPFNADYWLRWADLAEVSGERAEGALAKAEALNPETAAVWIRAGINAESAGDYKKAEYCLLRAAHVSRQYEPRWTLAGYYFRRSDTGKFWVWAKSALEWSYGDNRPLFDLCWRVSQSAPLILSRAIPPRREVYREYLVYLLSRQRLDAAEAVGRIFLERGLAAGDREYLLRYVNVMLEAHRWENAVSVWNALSNRRDGTARLSNGDFSAELMQSGFDWRTPATSGVSSFRQSGPTGMNITFTGRQPERCEVLQQFVSIRPGAPYRLVSEYQTSGVAAGSGLQWKVFDPVNGSEVLMASPHLANSQWTIGVAEFTAPLDSPVVLLALTYVRPSGSTLIEGGVRLRNVRLEESGLNLNAARIP